MPAGDTNVQNSVDAKPTANHPAREPEFHLTFVDSALPPVSLFRQIVAKFREPKFTVPEKYLREGLSGGAAPTGSDQGYHFTFVDSTLPPVSLFRQIVAKFREPKFTIPKEYYKYYQAQPTDGATRGSGSLEPEFHATFVDSTLPPVSLLHQVVQELREPKYKVPEKYLQRKAGLSTAEPPAPVWEDPNQFALPFEKPKEPAAPFGSWPVGVREPEYELVMMVDPEAIKWRRRTMYLSSLILHGILVLFLVFSPDLLRRGRQIVGLPIEEAPSKNTYLLLPPEVLRRLTEPPPERSPLSDQNRRAQGRSPIINPNGLHMPYSLGNTKIPEVAGGNPPAPAPAPAPAAGANTAPATPGPPANQPSNQPPQVAKNDGLRLEDVKPNTGGGSGLNLPNLTPGQAIQQSLQSAARAGRSQGGSGSSSGSGYGDGIGNFQNLQPNFSTEGPIILSDTQGVDFGPYLAGLIFRVRKNWYSMIPESARLGEKGRVGIVFEILKDGSVPQLRLVASSGADPLDRAAMASIHASVPFPPLPEQFTGNHLVLEFIFLYNLAVGQ